MKTRTFKIAQRKIGDPAPCFIIAEAGSNHNGDIRIAKQLIDVAAEAGADAIKFQLFSGKGLSSEEKIQRMLDQFQFDRVWLKELYVHAKNKGILLSATPFDLAAVEDLSAAGVPFYKIASGDLTNTPLLHRIAKKKKPIILSVGVATLPEIKGALQVIHKAGNPNVAILHCIADYPTRIEDTHLKVVPALKNLFKIPVGFSDHTMDPIVPSFAVMLGANVIEKHFTLSRTMQGPDHPFAMEPQEFTLMVENIRKAEKAMGSPVKRIGKTESGVRYTGRRGLYTNQFVSKGTVVTDAMISALRPCRGLEPKDFEKVIGKRAKRDLAAFESLSWKDIHASKAK